jgi:hypothetical protein
MEHEIWKDIKGYEGYYQVSNLGNVKSIGRVVQRSNFPLPIKERILKATVNKKGYLVVNLQRGGNAKVCTIHRLVAEAFLEKDDTRSFVDHINTDKSDNNASNLRWVTAQENSNNPMTKEHQKQSSAANAKHGGESKCSRSVFQFNLKRELIGKYPSTLEASKAIGVKREKIQACIYGSQIICGGFLWGLEPEYSFKTKSREKYVLHYINKHSI